MDIICPECKTEYEFDAGQATPSGVAVQCTSCGHTFKVRRKEVVEIETASRSAQNAQGGERPWMIRTSSNQTHKFQGLATLQQWIIQRRVLPDDTISRTGDTWKRLGDIPELASFFEAAQAKIAARTDRPSQQSTEVDDSDAGTSQGPQALGSMNRLVDDEPAFARGGAEFAAIDDGPAWERSILRSTTSGSHVAVEFDDIRPRRGRLVALTLISVILIAAGGLLLLKPQVFAHFFQGLFQSKGRLDNPYAEARELFLRDDAESLDQADRKLTALGNPDALVRAARAEIYTVWVQHLRDNAELLQRRAQAVERQAEHLLQQATTVKKTQRSRRSRRAQKPEEDQAQVVRTEQANRLKDAARQLRDRAAKLGNEASAKIQVATAQLEAARGSQRADRAEVYRATADLDRLLGRPDVLDAIAQARRTVPDDPECYYVEGLVASARGELSRAAAAFRAATVEMRARTTKPLARAMLQLALLELRENRLDQARELAQQVVSDHAANGWAQALLDQIDFEATGGRDITMAAAPDAAIQDGGQPTATGPDGAASVAETSPRSDATSPKAQQAVGSKRPQQRTSARTPTGYNGLIKAGHRAGERGRTLKALELYERALKLNPRGVEAITGLAYCHLDLQRFSSAVRRFRQAIRISPSYGDASIGMAEAYSAMGNRKKALDYYLAYLQDHPTGPKASLARQNVKELKHALGDAALAKPPEPSPQTPPADSGATAQPQEGADLPSKEGYTPLPAKSDQPPRPEAQPPQPPGAPDES